MVASAESRQAISLEVALEHGWLPKRQFLLMTSRSYAAVATAQLRQAPSKGAMARVWVSFLSGQRICGKSQLPTLGGHL